MLASDLPSYTPSNPPQYSSLPKEGERQLQCSRTIGYPGATGTFISTHNRITVSLHNQDQNAAYPIYAQRSLVAGAVSFSGDRSKIAQVRIKVR
jgi:hypothetical protein